MPTRKTLSDLLFHPPKNGRVSLISDSELQRLDLSTPFLRPHRPDFPLLVEEARKALRSGVVAEHPGHPLPDSIRELEFAVRYQLDHYLEDGPDNADRLYVLEFQGWRQYLLLGHTRHLLRRVNDHQLAATPHGFALVNGWASPGAHNAHDLEQVTLRLCGDFHGQFHFRERFYEMPFEKAVTVARAIFEASAIRC